MMKKDERERHVHIKSPTGCVHAVDNNQKQTNTLCNFRSRGAGYWHRRIQSMTNYTDEPVTCKHCLKLMGGLHFIKEEIAYQAINEYGKPVSELFGGLCIFPNAERAQNRIDYMAEMGRIPKNFRIRKVKVIYLEG
jgi:hypothetical protein